LEEYLESPAVTVIEWADKASTLLPRDHLRIELEHLGGDRRRMLLYPFTDRYQRLVQRAMAGED
jgi:tRNA A37 threonylcarbamoyladenosine biosynthesis protein TsaE